MSSLARVVAAVAITVLPLSSAAGQGVPNLTGTWVVAVEKSDFGPMPAPTSRTDVIDHQEPTLTIKRTIVNPAPAPSATVDLKYGVDGKSYTNTTPQGDVVSTLKWDGKVLVITSTISTPNGDAEIVDRLTLSDDGKTLTQNRAIAVQGQEIKQTVVLIKQ
jgi:hypothetical protein